jgi:hypothetical protein
LYHFFLVRYKTIAIIAMRSNTARTVSPEADEPGVIELDVELLTFPLLCATDVVGIRVVEGDFIVVVAFMVVLGTVVFTVLEVVFTDVVVVAFATDTVTNVLSAPVAD